MKATNRACVVLSDYPIKTMAYQRLFASLGELFVFEFRSLSEDFSHLRNAKLVVCDMNIMTESETDALAQLERHFPKANILFLEEDHNNMSVRFSDHRDICTLGKLAEIKVINSTLKELLLESKPLKNKTPRPKKERSLQA